MSEAADRIRTRRQQFAAPGSALDKTVRTLAWLLPALVGSVLAMMVITPLSPRGEVSFLLDRNKVDIADNRLSVENALYRGQDGQGRPFSIGADEAVQRSASVPVVLMRELQARILLQGGPASLVADKGFFQLEEDSVTIDGMVQFVASDGFTMQARNVTVDLADKTMRGSGGISGAVPAGTFSANAINADLETRTISLDGNARMRMVPGQLRLPAGL
ncbi:LPS export ABC transporter periplasmic protein LptC [Paraurantiacibacter namhicola]|uniref:Lipopolysaccharide-assembly, LptC-related n=1 Tax=Paraurantiacibacter namhicola TaxID=645517 RepID=A0A1C7D629_9SPHN|nr:LPS export ABC transporter periplasmic protein LptC [Paraurantiacibacter namhicola]ANU06919.1 hypothetical protein A6F65_00597 [Paraurantiacibacter namhicola]